jgi:hypothetical protein
MGNDTFGLVGHGLWLFGALALWPIARFILRRPVEELRILRVVFFAQLILQGISYLYVGYHYASGNRDWFMGLLVPYTVAILGWIASIVAIAIIFAGQRSRVRDRA